MTKKHDPRLDVKGSPLMEALAEQRGRVYNPDTGWIEPRDEPIGNFHVTGTCPSCGGPGNVDCWETVRTLLNGQIARNEQLIAEYRADLAEFKKTYEDLLGESHA